MTRAGSWIAWRDSNRLSPREDSTSTHGHRPGQFASCRLTHEVILWVVLAMGMLTDLPIRQVFKHARRLRVGERVAASLQPVRRTSAAGRGARTAPLHPGRSSPGPARHAGGVLPRVAVDGRSTARSSTSPTRRPTPPLSAAPRRGRAATGPSLRSANSAWSNWGPMSKSPWSSGPAARRAGDGRRLVPPSDAGDAPALGPRIFQLRTVAADGRTRGEGAGAGGKAD